MVETNLELTNEKDSSQVDYLIEEPLGIKDGPVKFEIVGDTAHLFEAEDFEKKEVLLLHDPKLDENSSTLYNSSKNLFESFLNHSENATTHSAINKFPNHPECNGYNTTLKRDLNAVFRINGSTLTSLLSFSDPNDCFVVLFYVIVLLKILLKLISFY